MGQSGAYAFSCQRRQVNLLWLWCIFLNPSFCLSDNISDLVDDISILVNLFSGQLLCVAFNQLADRLAFEDHVPFGIDDSIGEVLKRRF